VRTKSLLRNLGDEIRDRRKRRDLSQEALAHQAGLHTNVVGRLERGKYNPTVLTLHAIATKLDVPLHELLAAAAKRT
jgi:transcriptional regulator with XRE-family HTH domain